MSKTSTTPAQAKRLAILFGENSKVAASKYTSSTDLVLIKRGWVTPTGETGKYLNGESYALFEISAAGLSALSDYLIKLRIDQRASALAARNTARAPMEDAPSTEAVVPK